MFERLTHPSSRFLSLAATLAAALALSLAACGEDAPSPATSPPGPPAGAKALPADLELVIAPGETLPSPAPDVQERILWLAGREPRNTNPSDLTIDYPSDGTVFPPAFTTPTFHWHDPHPASTSWLLSFEFADGEGPVLVVTRGVPPTQGEIDEEALGDTNEVYQPNTYQASGTTWTPSPGLWKVIQARCRPETARLVIRGFARETPTRIVTRGEITFRTAEDPVGAPIFYRDVPLMPASGESGVIQPITPNALPLIAWRLRDVTRPDSRLVMKGMASCGNCHSFSDDGNTFGMDVDGPHGDKGTYAIKELTEDIVIEYEDVITWNSFPEKPEGHKTIGFLSRVSPDGRYVISTVNESLYVANFTDYRILQVFYPTRGILAVYDRRAGTMKALPGADDPEYVHCTPVWSPDGRTIVFSRAKAIEPYVEGQRLATGPNDPNEPEVRYDLYRIPFNDGAGGTPEPVKGASDNGRSNSFPKISPDGRWIVWTKARNGLLLRPDGKLWIVPLEGGVPREMECNLPVMNSWHSFSPNSRWLVWSSKSFTPYTQMFITHLDDDGSSSPAVLIPNCTAANRAVNIPEFLNADYDDLQSIRVPAVAHQRSFWEGVDHIRERRYAEAAMALRATLEKEPTFSRAHVNLGYALVALGEVDQAIEHYERALDLDPTSALAHNNLGLVKTDQGKHEEAIALFEKAIALDPFHLLAEINLGLAFSRAGRLREAARHFERALEIHPEHAMAHNNLGYVLERLGDRSRASVYYRTAIRIDPGLARARKNLAWLLRRDGDLDGALEQLEAALEIDPDDPGLHRAAGRVLGQQGKEEPALERLSEAARLAPEDAETQRLLAWLLATAASEDVRDGPRALALAEKAVRLTPKSAAALDTLAAAYAEVGRFEDAVLTLDRAIEEIVFGGEEPNEAVMSRRARYLDGKPWRRGAE